MSELSKKAAYLKGYVEGLGAELKSDEGKIITKLLDVIEEMAQEIEYLSSDIYENREMIDEIDDTLVLIADDLYGDDDDDDWDDDDDYDDDDDFFRIVDEDEEFDEEFDEEDENCSGDLFELQCPECGEDFMISYDDIVEKGEIECPHCKQKVELDVDFEDGDDDEWAF